MAAFRADTRGRRTTCEPCERAGGMPSSNPEGIADLVAIISDMYERDRRLTQENAELRLMLKNERRRNNDR
jgi:hypothetical protein